MINADDGRGSIRRTVESFLLKHAIVLHYPRAKVFLSLQAASRLQVSLQEGGLLSAWLLVMRWQDTLGKTHATVVWRDSVPPRTFKLLYVWLRWQPQQHEVKRK